MEIMTLPIKKKWYDMILFGDKREEYREIKPFYQSRFRNYLHLERSSDEEPWRKPEVIVRFRNGYNKDSPSFRARCTVDIGEGKPEWGAEPGKRYFILHILEIERKDT